MSASFNRATAGNHQEDDLNRAPYNAETLHKMHGNIQTAFALNERLWAGYCDALWWDNPRNGKKEHRSPKDMDIKTLVTFALCRKELISYFEQPIFAADHYRNNDEFQVQYARHEENAQTIQGRIDAGLDAHPEITRWLGERSVFTPAGQLDALNETALIMAAKDVIGYLLKDMETEPDVLRHWAHMDAEDCRAVQEILVLPRFLVYGGHDLEKLRDLGLKLDERAAIANGTHRQQHKAEWVSPQRLRMKGG